MGSIHSLILMLVMVSLASALATLLFRGARDKISVVALLVANLAVAVAAYAHDDQGLLFAISVGAFVVFVLLPGVLGALIRSATRQGNVKTLSRWVEIRRRIRFPQKADSVLERVVEVLRLVEAGHSKLAIDRGTELLANNNLDATIRLLIIEHLLLTYGQLRRWADAVALFEDEGELKAASASPKIAAAMVRCYAELGDLQRAGGCLAVLEQSSVQAETGFGELLGGARLAFLAHCGRFSEVETLLVADTPFARRLNPMQRNLWRGLARARAGELEHAEALWQEVREQDLDPYAAQVASERLASLATLPLGSRFQQHESLTRLADTIFERAQNTAKATPWGRFGLRRTPVTIVLLLMICFVHLVVTTYSGKDEWWLLLRLGANFRLAVQGGEVWRLLSSMFLHNGMVHLCLNGYALYLFGRFVEQMYGSGRFFSIYVFAGIVGSATSALMGDQQHLSVGASGAIFGLLGAAFIGLQRLRGRVPEEWRKQLSYNLLVILAIQIFIGFTVKVIDNAAHMGGLAGGALLAYLLSPGRLGSGKKERAVVYALAASLLAASIYSAVMVATNGHQELVRHIPTKLVVRGGLQAECPAHWMPLSESPQFALQDWLLTISPTVLILPAELADEHGGAIDPSLISRKTEWLRLRLISNSDVVAASVVAPLFNVAAPAKQSWIRADLGGESFYQINIFRQRKDALLMAVVRLSESKVNFYPEVVRRIAETMALEGG